MTHLEDVADRLAEHHAKIEDHEKRLEAAEGALGSRASDVTTAPPPDGEEEREIAENVYEIERLLGRRDDAQADHAILVRRRRAPQVTAAPESDVVTVSTVVAIGGENLEDVYTVHLVSVDEPRRYQVEPSSCSQDEVRFEIPHSRPGSYELELVLEDATVMPAGSIIVHDETSS